MASPRPQAAAAAASVVAAWETFVSDDKKLKKGILAARRGGEEEGGAVLPPIDPKTVNALQDGTWAATNQAAAADELSNNSASVSALLKANNALDEAERTAAKLRRPVKSKKKRLEEERQAQQACIEREAAASSIANIATPPGVAVPLALEQHTPQQHAAAVAVVNRPHLRAPTETIINTPPVVGALSYCAKMYRESEGPEGGGVAWYGSYQKMLAGQQGVTFQRTPLIRRSVLVTFLREPDPRACYERPCFNLGK